MEAPEVLAERLMSLYQDRLPLRVICDDILVVLRDGGVRVGDPVPGDLAAEAEQRLAARAGGDATHAAAAGPAWGPRPDRVRSRPALRRTMPA